MLRRARGSSQRDPCRQRFALRTQATSFAPLPGFQSSAIVQVTDGVACCRLTGHSRRTATPPLNSSVRLQERFRVSGKSTPTSRSRSASASFLRCASGWPAYVAYGRWVSSSQLARLVVRASIASVARAVCRNVTTSQAGCLSHAGPHHLAFLQCVWCGTIVHQRSCFGAA